MSTYLIKDGRTFKLAEDEESVDVIDWLIQERAEELDEPLVALSRQQVVTRLGRGIPTGFPGANVVVGDRDQSPTRAWWEARVQRYLEGGEDPAEVAERSVGPDDDEGGPEDTSDHWPRRSRQWDDVVMSGADHRVLIATSRGILTPAGEVKSRPLGNPGDLGKLVTKYQWSVRADHGDPEVWITGEALAAVGFPAEDATEETLPSIVAEFFGAEVKYHQSGYFTCEFQPEADSGVARTVVVVLMPATDLQPSKSRPEDRGIIGIEGTPTLLPDDETAAAHLLGDRIAWLHDLGEVLPEPRWTQVGVRLAEAGIRRARPKPKNDPAAKLVPSPLPAEISGGSKLPSQWWTPASWRSKSHHGHGDGVDVELDQQAAYLPSAEGLYLGYGTPQWVSPDAAVFDEQRPPFGLFQITVPAGDDLDGLHRKLPIPHPGMSWSQEKTFWATTVDVQQLIAPPENGGAGLAVAELNLEAAWVWPEQHQWLKLFGELIRVKLVAARAAGRADYESMLKAIYTSYLGRLAGTGEGAFSYPYLHHQQPAWYAAVEAFTRWRALKYATRIARDFDDLYPMGCLVDGWFYRVPKSIDPAALEDPVKDDGSRKNGGYRLKNVSEAA